MQLQLPALQRVPTEVERVVGDIHTTYWQKYTAALKRHKSFAEGYLQKDRIVGEAREELLAALPPQLLALEIPELIYMQIIATGSQDEHNMFGPHIDKIRNAALNIYVTTSNERTIFYDYADRQMVEVGAFTAHPGEVWLLNVDTPHGVDNLVPSSVREIISFSFARLSYAEVKAHLDQFAVNTPCH